MSALTDLFTAMANRIRFYTEKATTYTPSEMATGGIDDVFEAGRENATTPITPSNTSPARMTSGTGYKPTANGYAIQSYYLTNPSNNSPALVFTNDMCLMIKDGHVIESYDDVTPSSSPVSVASGDIVKIGGSGVIVDAIPTPTSITPSDSNPVALTADTPVNPTTNGYAIASQPQSVTPSASGAAFNSGIVKMSSGGYAYSQQPSSGYTLLKTEQLTFSNGVATLTGMTPGKEYMLILSFGWSNANTGTNCRISSITNTTNLTDIDTGTEYNRMQYCYTHWCIYTFKATGTSGVITKETAPSNPKARCYLFEKV